MVISLKFINTEGYIKHIIFFVCLYFEVFLKLQIVLKKHIYANFILHL